MLFEEAFTTETIQKKKVSFIDKIRFFKFSKLKQISNLSPVDDVYKKKIKICHKNFKKSETKIFLNFSYKQQYKYGFNAYLIHPFILMYNNTLINSSDSVLVSTPYLMDNLIKFHSFAFSIHNLELFPEILSTNKTPELRVFIEDLVGFLGQNHIRETNAGIFQYKFFDRTHNEIAYISKVFDEESAAFNFSLDESYSIKSHIAAKIKFLRSTYKDFVQRDKPVVNSIVFLNDLLGDSQLFDEFYEDAIISYNDALQGISTPNTKEASIETFLLWMRIKLKIAMVYEKMKYYEMALGILGTAMQVAQEYFSVNQTKKTTSNQDESSLNENKENKENNNNPIFREILHVTQQAVLSSIYVQEKLTEGLTFEKLNTYIQNYEHIHQMAFLDKENKSRDTLLASFYANIGTILYFKNKSLPLGTIRDVLKVNDLNKKIDLIKVIPIMSQKPFGKSLVDVSFDEIKYLDPSILNYHNVYPNQKENSKVRDFRFSFSTYVTYKSSLATILSIEPDKLEGMINECVNLLMDYRNVHSSRKLINLADSITKIADMLYTLVGGNSNTTKIEIWKNIRKEYEQIGDPSKAENKLINNLDSSIFNRNLNDSKYIMREKWDGTNPNFDYILSLYYLSGRIYLKAGRGITCGFQFRKILLSINSVCSFEQYYVDDNLPDFLEKTILKKIFEMTSWSSNSSDRPQISGYKYYFGINDSAVPPDLTKEFYQNLSNNPDTKEALILFANINLHKYKKSLHKDVNDIKGLNFLTPYNSISHQITRVMELALQVKINQLIFTKILNSELFENIEKWETDLFLLGFNIDTKKSKNCGEFAYHDDRSNKDKLNILLREITELNKNKNGLKLFKYYTELITNSLYSLHQIIIALNLYGINYMQNYSYLASFHLKMGDWLKHQNLCKILKSVLANRKEEDKSNFDALEKILIKMDNELNDLFGKGGLKNIDDPLTHYQLALQYYYKAMQMHSEGQTYKLMNNNLIFLEDDYNDNLYHFGAAIERQQINSGKIREKIEKLEKELKDAKLYKYENYINS